MLGSCKEDIGHTQCNLLTFCHTSLHAIEILSQVTCCSVSSVPRISKKLRIFESLTHSCLKMCVCLLSAGEQGVLLGDSAYPLRHFLLVPFKGEAARASAAAKCYNSAHSKQCMVIEQTFGMCKARYIYFQEPTPTPTPDIQSEKERALAKKMLTAMRQSQLHLL